jgi:anti-sigma B factor antagonist
MKPTYEPVHFAVDVSPGPATLIVLRGELDIAGVPAFEAALRDVHFPSLRHVVLDLEQLVFIDATGLRAVLGLHAACLKVSATLTIRPGPRRVQRVFELTGTDRLLPFSGR